MRKIKRRIPKPYYETRKIKRRLPKPYYETKLGKLYHGDCLDIIPQIDPVDLVLTDPPYEIGFMGKSWDSTGIANNVEMWRQVLRALKPGGYLFSFGGTRTYHRMTCAIEDAGFEIRDMIADLYDSNEAFNSFIHTLDMEQLKALRRATDVNAMLHWCYGSGFPKSLDIGKAVDKLQSNEREVGIERSGAVNPNGYKTDGNTQSGGVFKSGKFKETKGTSEWEGWGTALKPAHEPICMARKPLSEKTMAQNVLKWGTGGINIDESRVGTEKWTHKAGKTSPYGNPRTWSVSNTPDIDREGVGRFPANLIHDNSEEVIECFPDVSGVIGKKRISGQKSIFNLESQKEKQSFDRGINDSGNASRFFKSIIYTTKASKAERNRGCEGLPLGEPPASARSKPADGRQNPLGKPRVNSHPTVKPVALMEYLINMATRENQVVLDMFMGSGTTAVACERLNRRWIGIEKDKKYCEIAAKRIREYSKILYLF